jgi:3-hydroxyacyl-[acyl-carrier-protein] dehydratase
MSDLAQPVAENNEAPTKTTLDIGEILAILPHRYPFLLIDRVIDIVRKKRIVAIKNVTVNEPFFTGHFPNYPVMPGVLIVEALAQASGIAVAMLDENKGKLGVFAGIEAMKFKKQVVPGYVLKLESEILVSKMGVTKAKVVATVDGQVVAEGEIKFAMINV